MVLFPSGYLIRHELHPNRTGKMSTIKKKLKNLALRDSGVQVACILCNNLGWVVDIRKAIAGTRMEAVGRDMGSFLDNESTKTGRSVNLEEGNMRMQMKDLFDVLPWLVYYDNSAPFCCHSSTDMGTFPEKLSAIKLPRILRKRQMKKSEEARILSLLGAVTNAYSIER